jgi:hypothetical protein
MDDGHRNHCCWCALCWCGRISGERRKVMYLVWICNAIIHHTQDDYEVVAKTSHWWEFVAVSSQWRCYWGNKCAEMNPTSWRVWWFCCYTYFFFFFFDKLIEKVSEWCGGNRREWLNPHKERCVLIFVQGQTGQVLTLNRCLKALFSFVFNKGNLNHNNLIVIMSGEQSETFAGADDT